MTTDSKKIYLRYLFNDNGSDAYLNPEIVRGVMEESSIYGKDPEAEYIIVNPIKSRKAVVEQRRRGDGMDD